MDEVEGEVLVDQEARVQGDHGDLQTAYWISLEPDEKRVRPRLVIQTVGSWFLAVEKVEQGLQVD
jgi:hypothetical protein